MEKTQEYIFDSSYSAKDYDEEFLDLRNPDEFLTRIEGIESSCITKLILTTNLGHKIEVGNDLPGTHNSNPERDLRSKHNDFEQYNGPQPTYFEAKIPKGAQIVALSGVYGSKKLLSLMAYYS